MFKIIAIVCLLLIYQLVNYLFLKNFYQTIFSRTLKLIVLIFTTTAVYKWNAVIAGWVENAILYIPHITKINAIALIFSSILYRGIFLPIKRKVDKTYVLPLRWIRIGFLGLSLDIIKGPAYIIGAIINNCKP